MKYIVTWTRQNGAVARCQRMSRAAVIRNMAWWLGKAKRTGRPATFITIIQENAP